MTSANPEVADNHFLELMNIYHSTLIESLEKVYLRLRIGKV
jgi:hypothetical protein